MQRKRAREKKVACMSVISQEENHTKEAPPRQEGEKKKSNQISFRSQQNWHLENKNLYPHQPWQGVVKMRSVQNSNRKQG